MTNEEIIEGNKLIAEFMGGKIEIHKSLEEEIVLLGFEWYFTNIHDWSSRNLQYHSSWDWLILVVEKIESMKHPVYISSNNCTIYQSVGRDHGWIIDKYGKNKIEAVWLSVIEFIKNYENI